MDENKHLAYKISEIKNTNSINNYYLPPITSFRYGNIHRKYIKMQKSQ